MRLTSSIERRWAVDVAIALSVTAVQLAVGHGTASWGQHHTHVAVGWEADLLMVVGGLSLIARRRFPVGVLAIALASALWAGAISGHGMIWIVPIAAFFNAVIARKRAAAVASLVIGYVASFWGLFTSAPGHSSPAFALGVAAWLIVLLAIAELIRIRRQGRAAVARSREDQLQRRASEDRMRMARDLHDVLAHNISVINVQANTALHLMDRQPERAREALTAINDVSKQALTELRSVLGVLRTGDDDAPRAPSPGLAQLGDLLSSARTAGLDVTLTVAGDQRALPADVDLAAYRIIQEALTNTARHSASRTAEVEVGYDASSVRIRVDDAGPAADNGSAGNIHAAAPGNGITGMTERAQALGGSLTAGLRPGGGFRVSAWLPATSPADPSDSTGSRDAMGAAARGAR